MTVAYQRNTFTDTTIYRKSLTEQETSLDWLSATYNNLFEQIISDRLFIVTEAESGLPDAITARAYSTSELWWLICVYNGIIDPLDEIQPGLKLRVPDIDQSTVFLFQNSSNVVSSRVGSLVTI